MQFLRFCAGYIMGVFMKKALKNRLVRIADALEKLAEDERPMYSVAHIWENPYRMFWCGQGNVVGMSPSAVEALNKFVKDNFIAKLIGSKQAEIILKSEKK